MKPLLSAFAGTVVISFSAILVRLADVEPVTVTLFRGVYAIPAVALLALLDRGKVRRTRRERMIGVLAGIALGVDLSFWHNSIADVGAGAATVLGATQVVWIGVATVFIFRERITGTALVMIPVILVGIVLISGLGAADAYGANPIRGVFYGVLTGFFYAQFILLLRAAGGPDTSAAARLLDAVVGVTIVGLIAALIMPQAISFSWSWPSHGWLIVLAVGPQAIGWALITFALPNLRALQASVVILIQPGLTVLWAMLIFAEDPNALQWIGLLMVLVGVIGTNTAGAARPALVEPPHETTEPASG
ncbi:EamA-like transporter family protein [bacterium BMS3Bbin02]|nr:EamA-like transporter family protein [bacterium BMS3Bbin02]